MASTATYNDDSSKSEAQKFESCDTIRKKINLFLATKEMKQTAFLAAIGGVNSNSFRRFMRLKGKFSGCDNSTYEGARNFFIRREEKRRADVKEAKEQKKTEAKKRRNSEGPGGFRPSKIMALDPLAIVLPTDLPVYDDCDEVRSKIGQYIHKERMSQAGFARAIGMTSKSLSSFLSKRGFNQGAGSDVYYKAYRYFEEQRLQRGEQKSSHRLKSEADYPQGYPLVNPPTHEWRQRKTL